VSGPPGTGKSALVTEVVGSYGGQAFVKTAYINCMSVKSSGDVFSKVLADLCVGSDGLGGNESEILQELFIPKRKAAGEAYIVILDEIDHLLTLDLEILYTIFEWSLQCSSRLILIGIANALDLTDRFLPRLKARKMKPQLLPFLPYTAPQIASIITTRLQSLLPEQDGDCNTAKDYVPFLHPAAINLCSKKVASQTGDLRKAFDICRRAIDLIESETKQKHQGEFNDQAFMLSPSKTPLVENMNLSSSPSSISPRKPCSPAKRIPLPASLANLTPETAPRASIGHIARISSVIFGNGSEQRLRSLNLQQKAALCALIAHEKRLRASASTLPSTPSKSGRNKNVAAPSIRTLYETYVSLCKRDKVLHPLTSTEFRDVISSLEALSLITLLDGSNGGSLGLLSTPSKRGRAGGFGGGGDERRVGSCVGEDDVGAAVEGAGSQILRAILRNGGLE
jgi:cell division control protein 6